ncbi:recombination regulator RecX [Neobacillus dielmonensis]|uniref:recombination regulator RecX n=1 Tax=Neobacillus dielmonensis TaxID=1347369 RepID=UPI0005AB6578|nr:recombination regulator RecX [Neobacillus dielmonensis]
MAIITRITTQKKNQDRFNLYLDHGKGEEYAFSVDSDVLIKFELKKGMEIDELSIYEIQFQDDIRKAYNLSIQYLARRMRSEKEVSDYLIKKDVEEPIIKEVLHKLANQKYINDEDFALAFVRTQVNTTDKGPDLIKQELKEKGVAEDLISRALAAYSSELQLEKAVKLSQKFFSKSSMESQKIQKQKLEQILLRKGYPFGIIHLAVEELQGNGAEEEFSAIQYQGAKAHRKFFQYSGFEYEQKMKQALYRKGFSMELIEKYIASLNREEY